MNQITVNSRTCGLNVKQSKENKMTKDRMPILYAGTNKEKLSDLEEICFETNKWYKVYDIMEENVFYIKKDELADGWLIWQTVVKNNNPDKWYHNLFLSKNDKNLKILTISKYNYTDAKRLKHAKDASDRYTIRTIKHLNQAMKGEI